MLDPSEPAKFTLGSAVTVSLENGWDAKFKGPGKVVEVAYSVYFETFIYQVEFDSETFTFGETLLTAAEAPDESRAVSQAGGAFSRQDDIALHLDTLDTLEDLKRRLDQMEAELRTIRYDADLPELKAIEDALRKVIEGPKMLDNVIGGVDHRIGQLEDQTDQDWLDAHNDHIQ